jgi:hypothetical protein
MKGHQFISSKAQCVCSIRISPHALERLARAMPDVGHIGEGRARGFLGRSTVLDFQETRRLGYRPRATGRLEEGETSYYFLINERGSEALAVLTDDQVSGKLVWVTTYQKDNVTEIRRTVASYKMGRRKLRGFLDRKKGTQR